jgi:hypothetical protein
MHFMPVTLEVGYRHAMHDALETEAMVAPHELLVAGD